MFHTKVVAKKSKHTYYTRKAFPENRAIYVTGNVEKRHTARKFVEENIIRRKCDAWYTTREKKSHGHIA